MNRLEYLSAPFEREREYLERRAAEGIEARKAAGKLLLRQKDGAPLAGAQIRLRQTSHKFLHAGGAGNAGKERAVPGGFRPGLQSGHASLLLGRFGAAPRRAAL